jgi:YegS/Rv2252/BmrU family lipid kinase
MRTCLIYNPVAGNGKAAQVYENHLKDRFQRAGVEVFVTERPGHATELARAFAHDDNCTVISLGGDGTHHEVINGLMPEGKVIFAAIPAGTGNDFVRILGYPDSLDQIADVALSGETRRIDVGRADQIYFLTVCGVGFDAEVAGWVNRRKKTGSGKSVFVRGILYNLLHYRSRPMEIAVGHSSGLQKETFMMAACNTREYAGGMQICPGADPQDGKFTVIWIEHLNRLQVIPMLIRVLRGTHLSRRQVTQFEASTITVDGPPDLWVHADGEVLGHLPVTMEVVPSAIRVRMGANALPSSSP